MSELMQRLDSDPNNRMVQLLRWGQQWLKPLRHQPALHQCQWHQTRRICLLPAHFLSSQQTTYRKIAQSSGEQIKQPKIIPPSIYRREPTKSSKMATVMQNESRWDTGADPRTYVSPFDPFAQGALTTGENFTAASGLTTQVGSPDGVIHKRHHQPMFSSGANPPRPVASITQRKIIVKGNKNLNQGGR